LRLGSFALASIILSLHAPDAIRKLFRVRADQHGRRLMAAVERLKDNLEFSLMVGERWA
jgi:hypothetical protein